VIFIKKNALVYKQSIVLQSPFPWETTDFNVVAALKMPENFLETSS